MGLEQISGIIQTFFALVLVCTLIYITFRVIIPRLSEVRFSRGAIKIIERMPIDAKKSLFIIETGGSWMLIGASENGINLIRKLDEAEISEIEKTLDSDANAVSPIASLGSDFTKKLSEIMAGKGKKK